MYTKIEHDIVDKTKQSQQEKSIMYYIIMFLRYALSLLTLISIMYFGSTLDYSTFGMVINYLPLLLVFNYAAYMGDNALEKYQRIGYIILSIIIFMSIRVPTFYGMSLLFDSILIAKTFLTSWFIIIFCSIIRTIRGIQFGFVI